MAAIALLDNRDSFVWNLAQAFATLGADVDVRRSDRVTPTDLLDHDALVLSPGPGRPEGAGVCIAAVRELSGTIPILGVCLGHQAVAAAFGATITRGTPCHGKAWGVSHRGEGLFRGLPSPLHACRYHSLTVDPERLPAALRVDATTPEGEIMALRHRDHSTFGLQFHPESFRTPEGTTLLAHFLEEVG